eukprot:COSAG03_NODE_123_length_12291_cov_19.979413_14_plen_49_part_01
MKEKEVEGSPVLRGSQHVKQPNIRGGGGGGGGGPPGGARRGCVFAAEAL